MSFVKNDNQQLTLLDSTFNLTEQEKRMLEKSWAKTFADKFFQPLMKIYFLFFITIKNFVYIGVRNMKTSSNES